MIQKWNVPRGVRQGGTGGTPDDDEDWALMTVALSASATSTVASSLLRP